MIHCHVGAGGSGEIFWNSFSRIWQLLKGEVLINNLVSVWIRVFESGRTLAAPWATYSVLSLLSRNNVPPLVVVVRLKWR